MSILQGYHFGGLFLQGGWHPDTRLTVSDGLCTAIELGVPAQAGDERHGLGLPGLPNLHSHAFQRGMAGLAERRGPSQESFWTWRETMYRFVDQIGPDELEAIAALAFAEMLETGFTRVGEFHYVHHDRTGAPFADPGEMSHALIRAAAETGIALTLLPVFYAHAGFGGRAAESGQKRFVHDVDGFARLLVSLDRAMAVLPDAVRGVAPHSLRAVTPDELNELVALAGAGPVHIHVAEQAREVNDCLAWSGARPIEWLLGHAPVDLRWCLVHATHMTDAEADSMARTGAVAGLCPITEANLGDGLFNMAPFASAGGRYGIGSDSNVLIDASEELRLLEYGQRLTRRERNVLAHQNGSTGRGLYGSALTGGAHALGAQMHIAIGQPFDMVSLDTAHVSLAGSNGDAVLDQWIFAAGRRAIDCVWRRGEKLVAAGHHRAKQSIETRYRRTLGKLNS